MAKRKVITWPEHKKLLQKRHGAVAAEPTVHGTVRKSKNQSLICGITAIEMALELRPHPELSKLLREVITTRGRVDVYRRLNELNLADSNNLAGPLHALGELYFFGFDSGLRDEGFAAVRYKWMLEYTARYVYSPISPDETEYAAWVEAVNQRCAQRLAFTRPGSSDIEMQPPPLLEY